MAISRDGPCVTEQQVRNIKIPTLIIGTAQDHVHPLSHCVALHNMISNSRLVELTPKGVDKARYVQEFQSTLLKFFEENA
jgi:pimeloyl-ACP methyl ester carboxylesterase